MSAMPTTTMRPAQKLASVAAMPLAFVVTFLLAFLVMGLADAYGQPAETPPTPPTEAGNGIEPSTEPKYAPPSDDVPGTDDEGHAPHGTVEGASAQPAAAHGHHDPSKHFNFFGMGYSGKDAYGGKFGDGKMVDAHTGEVVSEEEPMSAPFIFMILNFALLMALLIWKGKPVAQQLAADRHDQIKNALDEAAKLRKQAADKLAEYETKLKDADAEIKAMVDGIRKDAETDKARILANAEKASAQMKRDAEQRIAAEIELARANLTREVTAAATTATEKLLREKMNPTDQSQLVSTFITDIQTTPSSVKERV